VCAWHEHHEETRVEITRRHRLKHQAILAGPSLAEAYAVLTRLPSPHRLSPGPALELLETNWGSSPVITLTDGEYWRVLRKARDQGVGGGQVYDALIAACARKGQAETLLTWNLDHFMRFQTDLKIATPSPASGRR
jgi:predicted nucleic acid-binding protein